MSVVNKSLDDLALRDTCWGVTAGLRFGKRVAVSYLDLQNRSPSVTRTPDFRNRVERRYDVLNFVPKSPAEILAKCWLPLGTTDDEYTDCYLIDQKVEGQEGDSRKPTADPPVLLRVFEQLDGLNETLIGQPGVEMDQYGDQIVSYEYWQLNVGTAIYQVPGTTAAPAPFSTCILRKETRTNDGTLRKILREYTTGGILSDNERLLFGGKLLLRELKYLNQVPPTPSGYTLTTHSTEFVDGLPVYTYGFVKAGSDGLGGGIGQSIHYGQSVDEGVTAGTTTTTLKFVTDQTVSTNPFTAPSGTVLIDISYEDEAGYRLWTGVYVKATGTVRVDADFRPDGSIAYTVTTLSMADATPAYPGSGTGYNISLTHSKRDGYIENVGVWIKPPGSVAYRRQVQFPYPGLAYFVGTDLILQPGTTQELLGTVTVSYSTSQDTTTPFTVTQWAGFIETYTPTDTGIAVNNQYGLNGYLAAGVTISGSGTYKGVAVTAYSATRFASTPATLPTGPTTISVENEPYLTDIAGTMVFKRSVTTVTL